MDRGSTMTSATEPSGRGKTEMENFTLTPPVYIVRKQVLFLEQKRGGQR